MPDRQAHEELAGVPQHSTGHVDQPEADCLQAVAHVLGKTSGFLRALRFSARIMMAH